MTIAQAVFEVKWYNMPKDCRSTLQFMLFMSNQPLFYKLVLGQKVNMEAYMAVSILLSSFNALNIRI